MSWEVIDGTEWVCHKLGGEWFRLSPPRRFHRCSAQTSAGRGDEILVERCACGAIRVRGSRWLKRNSRSRSDYQRRNSA